jgi:plasmid stabilization system protein ParE
MLIEWTQAAEDALVETLAWYIEQADKETGQRIVTRLFAAADRLEVFPHSGRPGLLPKTRELVVPDLPYFLVYRVTDKVEILRIMHTSRLWVGE